MSKQGQTVLVALRNRRFHQVSFTRLGITTTELLDTLTQPSGLAPH